MEHADEETIETSSIRSAVLCLTVSLQSSKQRTVTDSTSASIITMIRIPFVNKFESQTNLPCKPHLSLHPFNTQTNPCTVWVANIVLCSNVETGIGCFASSLPALRHYFQNDRDNSTDPNSKHRVATTITAGGRSRRQRGGDSYHGPSDHGFSLSAVHHGRDQDAWERIHDGASDKSTAPMNDKRIYHDRTYTVDVESA